MRPSDPIAHIAERYQREFRASLGSVRRIGREAEFPVVLPDGRAGDAGLLWEPLLDSGGLQPIRDGQRLLIGARGPDFLYQAEVGKPTIELSLGPYDDLWELQRGLNRALDRVIKVAEGRGLRVLGYGIQPRSPASARLLTARPHYLAYYQALGKPWLRLTTTAADQTHVDISREEILDSVNWMNLLSGPIIALCANSSVYNGRKGRNFSGREGFLRELGTHRYGMTPERFDSFEALVRYLGQYPANVLPQGSGFRMVEGTFLHIANTELSRDPEALYDAFLWHEHYIWNSARARVLHSTIEVRPACQQPPLELMASSALILGLVEALPQISEYFMQVLAPDPWPAMERYRQAAIRKGLAAREPAPQMMHTIIEFARAGLVGRGRGEEGFLRSIDDRLASREPPAAGVQQTLQKQGMRGLLQSIRIRQGSSEREGIAN